MNTSTITKIKRVLPEDVIVHAYRTTPATSRDLAAQYGTHVTTILAILHAHLSATAFKELSTAKAARKISRAMQIKLGTNRGRSRPPRSEEI